MPVFWDTPHRHMINHTRDSHQISSQNNTKSKLQIKTKYQKIQILKFCKKLYTQHAFWSCLIRCINMKWIQPELYALQSRWTDRRTDGRTDGWTDGQSETNIPPNNLVVCGV